MWMFSLGFSSEFGRRRCFCVAWHDGQRWSEVFLTGLRILGCLIGDWFDGGRQGCA